MKITTAIAAFALISATACAQRPDAIAPVSMGNAFANVDCQSASDDLRNERQTLEALSAQQNSAATSDAVGVFLLGLPLSSISGGDKSGMVATSKGKVIALEARLSSC
jgi:hypothetical protein